MEDTTSLPQLIEKVRAMISLRLSDIKNEKKWVALWMSIAVIIVIFFTTCCIVMYVKNDDKTIEFVGTTGSILLAALGVLTYERRAYKQEQNKIPLIEDIQQITTMHVSAEDNTSVENFLKKFYKILKKIFKS